MIASSNSLNRSAIHAISGKVGRNRLLNLTKPVDQFVTQVIVCVSDNVGAEGGRSVKVDLLVSM
jgi:hypothetical protein